MGIVNDFGLFKLFVAQSQASSPRRSARDHNGVVSLNVFACVSCDPPAPPRGPAVFA